MPINEVIKKYSMNSSNLVYIFKINSPIGKIVACADDNFLLLVMYEDSKNFEKRFQVIADELKCRFIDKKNETLDKFEVELNLYFEGKLKSFSVPIKTIGSEFQKEVWNKLVQLPYASLQSYGDFAKEMGRPASHSRAVGAACGANAHLIVVPCHRLVASGSKGGFSCGIDRKEWLLQHEKKFA